MKNKHKNIQSSIGEQTHVNKMTDPDKVRVASGKQMRLDLSHYLAMPEYEDDTLFWCSTEDGDVDRWLGLGARPIPRRSRAAKTYKGLNDNIANEWECVPGVGVDSAGKSVTFYALALPTEEYHKLRIQPKIDRNKEIRNAMGVGKITEESRAMPNVTGLKTYAPNLPTGGRGLEILHDV